jgi:molecular chaperone HtpG
MTKDFLTDISTKKLKKEIRNICDSYSNPWDIFAELAQNSIDAINRWNKKNQSLRKEHYIQLEIYRNSRSIIIKDSGVGFRPDTASQMLAPNNGDKDDDSDLIGEKGVGLTYAIFSSNKFILDSASSEGIYKAEIYNARMWKNNNDYSSEAIPKIQNEIVEKKNLSPDSTYTLIQLQDIEVGENNNSYDFFKMSVPRIEYYLRTKTAIGSTKKRFGKSELKIRVTLKVYDDNNNLEEGKEIVPEYFFPDTFFKESDVIDIDEYEKIAGSLSDDKKRKKLQGKCLKVEGKEDKYNYYFFFVPAVDVWEKISRSNNLFVDDTVNGLEIDVKNHLTISTKGMPTSFEVTPPSSGAAGYWHNLFGIVEYDNIKFDIGRKYIHGIILNPIKALISKKFNKLSSLKQFVAKDKSPAPTPFGSYNLYTKNNEFDRIRKEVPDLNFDKISYLKFPDEQEAPVSAIFHELIGSGVLKGYFGLREGYKQNYDFWGIYRINKSNLGRNIRDSNIPDMIEHPIVIEYKYEASTIIEDVKQNIKHFMDIDLIVCWDINVENFKKNGIDVEVINESDIYYYGSNYFLDWPSTYDLGKDSKKIVLALKYFIDNYKKQN